MSEEIHTRNQFQVDRLAFFSDAVIAIAITLLVLEIKIPPLGQNVSWHDIATKYNHTISQHLLALLVSFYAIGNLWMRHHELFEHVKNYNKALIKTNLYFLFTIMLLPLSIAFNFEENNPAFLRTFIILLNLFLSNFCFYVMVLIITHKRNSFHEVRAKQAIIILRKQSLYITLALLTATAISLISVNWCYLPFILLWAYKQVSKLYKKYAPLFKARTTVKI